jgi:hypothetical protein
VPLIPGSTGPDLPQRIHPRRRQVR